MPKNVKIINQSDNLKERNAIHTFQITVRDIEHFYKLVNWLNINVGRGEDQWTMRGKILKSLKRGIPVNTKIYIFKEDFDVAASLYLSLL